MINDVYIFDDIVDKEYQNKIKDLAFGGNFSWYLVEDVSVKGNPYQKRPGFKHNFISADKKIRSDYHSDMMPIILSSLNKINFKHKEITLGRAFLQLPLNLQDRHIVDTPHVDSDSPHLVVLYYLIDNEASTIIYENKFEGYDKRPEMKDLKIKAKVKPKQGRVVIFNGLLWHTAEQPEYNNRCIINYNII